MFRARVSHESYSHWGCWSPHGRVEVINPSTVLVDRQEPQPHGNSGIVGWRRRELCLIELQPASFMNARKVVKPLCHPERPILASSLSSYIWTIHKPTIYYTMLAVQPATLWDESDKSHLVRA